MSAAHGPSSTREPRAVACMEVWGGSGRFSGLLSMPGNDVSVVSEPHAGGAEGGDVYYLSNCAAGSITRFVLADISGHGVEAAGIARMLRDLMRRHINTANQTRFALELNRAFLAAADGARFATALLATYFAPTDHLVICNAGHPRPLHFSAATGEWRVLDGQSRDASTGRKAGIANLPLGIIEPTNYEQFAVRLGRDDVVLVYSDALTEARGVDGAMLGESGLLAEAARVDPTSPDIAERVLSAVRARTPDGIDDDATVIAIRHNAADPPAPGLSAVWAAAAAMLGLGIRESLPGSGAAQPV
ncbi:MAG: serine/threonine-protein phosphatase [Phycisphaeraceae bacterium]|nr:serine/threonine-protein phosphatase [Phycisphaeraceae bacterium]